MMDHRLRRWPNIEPVLGQCIVFARNPANTKRLYNTCTTLYKCYTNVLLGSNRSNFLVVQLPKWSYIIRFCMLIPAYISMYAGSCTAPQSQKAVSAYLWSKQILPFGFARQLHVGISTPGGGCRYRDQHPLLHSLLTGITQGLIGLCILKDGQLGLHACMGANLSLPASVSGRPRDLLLP